MIFSSKLLDSRLFGWVEVIWLKILFYSLNSRLNTTPFSPMLLVSWYKYWFINEILFKKLTWYLSPILGDLWSDYWHLFFRLIVIEGEGIFYSFIHQVTSCGCIYHHLICVKNPIVEGFNDLTICETHVEGMDFSMLKCFQASYNTLPLLWNGIYFSYQLYTLR